jgi:glycerol-3-phosphate dehydrogenase (NAD(P)+)
VSGSRVAVVGAGAWGTTLAAITAVRVPTRLWAREQEVVAAVRRTGENEPFLAGVPLPPALTVTNDLADALAEADVVVVAVPAQHLREAMTVARPHVPFGAVILSVAKGIEVGTGRRMTEVLHELFADRDPGLIGVLSGPNLAREVAVHQPAATCVAFTDPAVADAVQRLFMSDALRVYTSDDVIGCEIGGAAKNVIAIAAGIADGLGYGMNTMAALITRGLAELTRLGVALGGHPLTFLGLAGNGDLLATCTSPQSRNRQVGEALASGRTLADIVAGSSSVAEGVATAPALLALAASADVEMPISTTVAALLRGELTPPEIVPLLMQRSPKGELHGLGTGARTPRW